MNNSEPIHWVRQSGKEITPDEVLKYPRAAVLFWLETKMVFTPEEREALASAIEDALFAYDRQRERSEEWFEAHKNDFGAESSG